MTCTCHKGVLLLLRRPHWPRCFHYFVTFLPFFLASFLACSLAGPWDEQTLWTNGHEQPCLAQSGNVVFVRLFELDDKRRRTYISMRCPRRKNSLLFIGTCPTEERQKMERRRRRKVMWFLFPTVHSLLTAAAAVYSLNKWAVSWMVNVSRFWKYLGNQFGHRQFVFWGLTLSQLPILSSNGSKMKLPNYTCQ